MILCSFLFCSVPSDFLIDFFEMGGLIVFILFYFINFFILGRGKGGVGGTQSYSIEHKTAVVVIFLFFFFIVYGSIVVIVTWRNSSTVTDQLTESLSAFIFVNFDLGWLNLLNVQLCLCRGTGGGQEPRWWGMRDTIEHAPLSPPE